MFYILLFSGLAVLLVIAGGTAMARYRSQPPTGESHHATDTERHKRKAQRAQSKKARRKRK